MGFKYTCGQSGHSIELFIVLGQKCSLDFSSLAWLVHRRDQIHGFSVLNSSNHSSITRLDRGELCFGCTKWLMCSREA